MAVEYPRAQGSVLGPLLFLIYINYLPAYIKSNCKIFADDLKIYLSIRNSLPSMVGDLLQCQRDINMIVKVAGSWGLELNPSKCSVLRFCRNRAYNLLDDLGTVCSYHLASADIPFSSACRDLGVIVDNQLKFHSHVKSVTSKASGLCQNLLSSTLNRTQDFMITLYTTHIRPIIEFSSCVWNVGYLEDSRLLERVQRRWTKQIDGLWEEPYSERLRILDLYSVKGRLLRADLIKYWKIFNLKSCLNPDDLFEAPPSSITRGHRFKIATVRHSLDCHKRFFSMRRVALWNSLPDSLVSAGSVETFKHGLHLSLGQLLYDFD